ncbi:MAG: DUF1905 domain-containing protein [Acidimicrobiaceae bacterium]|nr:DUF1905 domain-containing protein [Acidimicrobiaceae bacterium]
MELQFEGEIIFWRGPSPFHFVEVPPDQSDQLRAVSGMVSYGWGVIPVVSQIGSTRWKTSLFPKGEAYLVPVKSAVRLSEQLEIASFVDVRLVIEGVR